MIADEYLNQRVIRAKAPSVYFLEFKKNQSNNGNSTTQFTSNCLDEYTIKSIEKDSYLEFIRYRSIFLNILLNNIIK